VKPSRFSRKGRALRKAEATTEAPTPAHDAEVDAAKLDRLYASVDAVPSQTAGATGESAGGHLEGQPHAPQQTEQRDAVHADAGQLLGAALSSQPVWPPGPHQPDAATGLTSSDAHAQYLPAGASARSTGASGPSADGEPTTPRSAVKTGNGSGQGDGEGASSPRHGTPLTPSGRPLVLKPATAAPGARESFKAAMAAAAAAEATAAAESNIRRTSRGRNGGGNLTPRSVIGSSIYGANNGSGSPVSPVNRRQGTRSKWIAEPEETAGGTLAAAMAVQRRQAASPEPVDDGGFSERLKQARAAEAAANPAQVVLPPSPGGASCIHVQDAPARSDLVQQSLQAMGWQGRAGVFHSNRFDPLCTLLAALFQMPMAVVLLADSKYVYPAGSYGVTLEAPQRRAASLAAWTYSTLRPEVTIIPDCTADLRTRENAAVTAAPGIRFLASVPLLHSSGHRLGTLCLLDRKQRTFDAASAKALANLAVVASRDVERAINDQPWSPSSSPSKLANGGAAGAESGLAIQGGSAMVDVSLPGWPLALASAAFTAITGVSEAAADDSSQFWELFSHSNGSTGEAAAASYSASVLTGSAFTLEVTRSLGMADATFSCRFMPVAADALDTEAPFVAIPGSGVLPGAGAPASPAATLYFVTAHRLDQGKGAAGSQLTAKTLKRLESAPARRRPPFEDVQLGAQLGRGSCGAVFAGACAGGPVAVKVLEFEATHEVAAAVREEMESVLGSVLKHPNVMRALQYTSRHLPTRGVRSTRSNSARISAGTVNGLGSPTSTPRKSSGSGNGGGGGPDFSPDKTPPTSPPMSPMNPGVSPSAAALLKLARSGGSGSGLIGSGSTAEGEGAHLFVRMQMWIVQEHLCGLGSLQLAMDKGSFRAGSLAGGSPNLGRILTVALQVASAMAYMHVRGIHHGNLTPSNVLLALPDPASHSAKTGTFLVAKVADFGLSGTGNSGSEMAGTVTHLAPEALQGGPPARQADVFSFGVLLWELYVGERPWAGLDVAAIVAARTAALPACSGLAFPAGTPPAFQGMAMRCLSPNPHARPAMDEIEGQLGGMVAALAAGTLPPPLPFPIFGER